MAASEANVLRVAGTAQGTSRWVLASLGLCTLLPSLGTSIANVALPTLADEFGVPFQQVQWVVLAYLLAMTTMIVSIGRLGDLFGRRRLLLVGIAVFTAASILCGIAPGMGLLLVARALQGLGAATMMALAMALVGGAASSAKLGRAMGLLGSMSAIGTALGPSLGGVMISTVGWRAIFLVNLPLGALVFLLAYRHLPADRRRGAGRIVFDHAGTLLLALTLAAYALAMTVGRGHYGLLNLGLLLAALLGAGAVLVVESRVASPLFRPAMLRDPVIGASLAMGALVATVMMATLVVGPFYLSRSLGLGAAGVGLAMSMGPLVAAIVGVPSGRLVDRLGAQPMMRAGLLGMVSGSILLFVLALSLGSIGNIGVMGYIAPTVVMTAGYALFQSANNSAVMADVAADQRGVVSAMLNLSRNLGLVTGASAMGAVFAIASAASEVSTASAAAVATGMRTTFAVASGLLLIALAIAHHGAVRRARVA